MAAALAAGRNRAEFSAAADLTGAATRVKSPQPWLANLSDWLFSVTASSGTPSELPGMTVRRGQESGFAGRSRPLAAVDSDQTTR